MNWRTYQYVRLPSFESNCLKPCPNWIRDSATRVPALPCFPAFELVLTFRWRDHLIAGKDGNGFVSVIVVAGFCATPARTSPRTAQRQGSRKIKPRYFNCASEPRAHNERKYNRHRRLSFHPLRAIQGTRSCNDADIGPGLAEIAERFRLITTAREHELIRALRPPET